MGHPTPSPRDEWRYEGDEGDQVGRGKDRRRPRWVYAAFVAALVVGFVLGCPFRDTFTSSHGHGYTHHHEGGHHGKHGKHSPDTHGDAYFGKTLAPANYTVVTGLFVQDDPGTNATGYDLLKDGFGLVDRGVGRWGRFVRHMTDLNKNADAYTTYKVVFIARHGEGYHNVAESKYGSPAWNCYWSLQNGDGNLTWGPDATLTPLGESQARACNAGWKEQMRDGVPLPQTLYSSPMRRSASTLAITWDDILLRGKGAIKPVIKEMWREMIGLHTCDKRSDKSVLRDTYPHFTFEPSFTEHDPLWDATYQETQPQQTSRIRLALGDIFATDPATFIGITAHSGVINAFFKAVGHREFQLKPGGFIPVVLKATSHPTATFSPIIRGQSATAPACTADPRSELLRYRAY